MESGKTKEMEIKKIVDVLKKRLWIIIIFAVLITSLATIYQQLNKPIPIYESTARLLIHDNTEYFETLIVFIKEPPILEKVIEELSLSQSVQTLTNQIQVGRVDNSRIVTLTVLDRSQEQATQIANTLTSVYQQEVAKTLDFQDIAVFSEAHLLENPVPINPESSRLLWMALVLGITLGIGFVLILDSLDNRLRSAREIERLLEVPVIGSVSLINKKSLAKKSRKKSSSSSLRGETIGS
ncbi:YveK family protein [Alkalihalobacillus pseudalcaliphilus]|uniref:YveK family protein n=1 Tax=Alkalihalobacillus pseudalcaliphilus TaxID=79884 RepID=UPI0023615838|nr:Wzz/FepE/Etk N-terminal domain-containing protein [Alkalihalobacillus pseudalcaliphilus]